MTADEGSDLDLIIARYIADRASEYLRLREALGCVAPGIGVDLLIYPLAEHITLNVLACVLWSRAAREGVSDIGQIGRASCRERV